MDPHMVIGAEPFGSALLAEESAAVASATALAMWIGMPCGIWARDGWYTVCALPPDLIEPDPVEDGWELWGVLDPGWDINETRH